MGLIALRRLPQQHFQKPTQPDPRPHPRLSFLSALHWAVYHDDLEAIDLLIAAGAKVDLKNREGVTPLRLASLFGNSRIIERLIKAGADVKQTGPAGETMLMLAARNGNPDAIKSLVAAGAGVNAKEPIRDNRVDVGGRTAAPGSREGFAPGESRFFR